MIELGHERKSDKEAEGRQNHPLCASLFVGSDALRDAAQNTLPHQGWPAILGAAFGH